MRSGTCQAWAGAYTVRRRSPAGEGGADQTNTSRTAPSRAVPAAEQVVAGCLGPPLSPGVRHSGLSHRVPGARVQCALSTHQVPHLGLVPNSLTHQQLPREVTAEPAQVPGPLEVSQSQSLVLSPQRHLPPSVASVRPFTWCSHPSAFPPSCTLELQNGRMRRATGSLPPQGPQGPGGQSREILPDAPTLHPQCPVQGGEAAPARCRG